MTYYFKRSQTGGMGINRFNRGVQNFIRNQRMNRRIKKEAIGKIYMNSDPTMPLDIRRESNHRTTTQFTKLK